MSVLLLSPTTYSPQERFVIPCAEIPLSLCYLASYLERHEIPADIVDCEVEPRNFNLQAYLDQTNPRVVGVTSFSPYIEYAHSLAKWVKSWNKDTPVVLGGYHASAFPRQALREFEAFDALVFGEGEESFRELVEFYLGGGVSPEGIPGVAWRTADGEVIRNKRRAQIQDMDTLPFPAREKLRQDRYTPNPVNYLQQPTTALLASRGCHHNCTFCSKYLFKGERVRSADNIHDEMLYCADKYGTRDFRFYDDNLMYHRDTAMALCRLLSSNNYGFSWNCFSRVDTMDEELLKAMKAAGCYQVKYGVETGSAKTLELIKKGITFDQSRRAVALAKKVGIECQISMMIGLPDETEQDVMDTIRFAVELSPDLILFNIFKPIPGSVLYNKLKRENRLAAEGWQDFLVKSPKQVITDGLTNDRLSALMKKAYASFYFRPRYILQRLKWLARAPGRELKRYATAARIFAQTFLAR